MNYNKLKQVLPRMVMEWFFSRFSRSKNIEKEKILMNWLGLGEKEYAFDRKHFFDFFTDIIDDDEDDDEQLIPEQIFEHPEEACLEENIESPEIVHDESYNYNLEEAELFNEQREIGDDSEKQELIWKKGDEIIEYEEREVLKEKKAKESNSKLNKRKGRINR